MTIVPRLFGLPQIGQFSDLVGLAVVFVVACIFFSEFWSSIITRRETVFLLFLFVSPICLFLTGFSWPWYSMPRFCQVASYLFPTTFAVQTFMNINCAGADLVICHDAIRILTIQSICYFVLACISVWCEKWVIVHRQTLSEARARCLERRGLSPEDNVLIIGGEEALEQYRERKRKS